MKDDKSKGRYFHYKDEGHLKRNYSKYLKSLKAKRICKDGECDFI